MAINAIEQVRSAETKASEIINDSEREASERVIKAAEAAKVKMDELLATEEEKMKEALDKAQNESQKEFEAFAETVLQKCDERRKEILADSGRITDKILEAVKMG